MVWGGNPKWPPGDTYKMDKPARRWKNAPRTRADDLHNALSFFLTTGWPTESLDSFLASIVPPGGWLDEMPKKPKKNLHFRGPAYGPALYALFNGYWTKDYR